jgi:4-diphosphocytidyl-2-C-methyl-D-erythritol kinase
MIVFPNAKINIGLRILRRRKDGYHDLESVFYPVRFRDILEIQSTDTVFNEKNPEIYVSGHEVSPSADNLCWKAACLLGNRHGIPRVRMHLHKKIPPGSGLGGGSSDASFTLLALNKMFDCGLNEAMLRQYASEIGSDCPFFILNRPALVSGRGDVLEPISLNLRGYHLVLVFPEASVSTAEAYAGIRPSANGMPLREILQMEPREWRGKVVNDFEPVVTRKYPVISRIIELLYDSGAEYVSMSGSGSAVYGIFSPVPQKLHKGLYSYRTHIGELH